MIMREVLFLLTFCEAAKRTVGVRAGSPLYESRVAADQGVRLLYMRAHDRPPISFGMWANAGTSGGRGDLQWSENV